MKSFKDDAESILDDTPRIDWNRELHGLNPADYLHHLDGTDMTEAKNLEYIEAVGKIAQHFVDLAFGETPEQIILAERAREATRKARKT